MKVLKSDRIKRIHVLQHALRANRKDGGDRPVFTIQMSDGPIHARRVAIHGSSTLVSRPEKPLSCGATLWIETKARLSYE